jgi:hypothetical protein
MSKILTGTILALAVATVPALAQTATPASPSSPAAPAVAKPVVPAPAAQAPVPAPVKTTAPAPAAAPVAKPQTAAVDKSVADRFKGLDKSGNGVLDGAELKAFKPHLAKIDTDKDGKISLSEFAAATKAGVIK